MRADGQIRHDAEETALVVDAFKAASRAPYWRPGQAGLDSAGERALGFLGVELGLYELRPGRAAEGTGGHDVAGRCCVPIRPLCPGVLSAALAGSIC